MNLKETLTKYFNNHRVIFWYDENQEFTTEFQEMDIPNVNKIQVQGNEFEIKHRIEKQQPKDNFLLYFPYEKPENHENWLLDLELAYYVFYTDKEAMILQELGLGFHLKNMIKQHIKFFDAKSRRDKLKAMIDKSDEHNDVRRKMLSVIFGSQHLTLTSFIHAHATAFLNDDDRKDKDLDRFNLKDFYWQQIARKYNYISDNPSIYDFLMEIFAANFPLIDNSHIRKESLLILTSWKDTVSYHDSFGEISDKIADDLKIEDKIQQAGLDQIVDDDLFRLTDMKIIQELVHLVSIEQISQEKVLKYIKQRENKFWSAEFEHYYQCIRHAMELVYRIHRTEINEIGDFSAGLEQYTREYYRVDYHYRKFIYHYRQKNQPSLLAELSRKVEKVYSNDWLLVYNNQWQSVINDLDHWPVEINSQQNFFRNYVKPFIDKKQRLFVIISDAYRYECGEELYRLFKTENRFDAELDYMISSLPSYTKLGMASLLPHEQLAIKPGSDDILADGKPTIGTANRASILNENSGVSATAITAEELMKMDAIEEGRKYIQNYELIYVYHNGIDHTGDDKTSETKVFEAVEHEIEFLSKVIKKIVRMNGTNFILTSDHGFIYQHNIIEDSDFCDPQMSGEVWKNNRRFIIGQDLIGNNAILSFNGNQLNLKTEADILIPKSINRIRIQGSGTRFVHGGATPQEVVIPVIKISNKRKDTTRQVDIDIIKSNDKITTNILAVSFIQSELVSEKVLPREIRASLQAEDGTLLSDYFNFNFDIKEGLERQREIKHKFTLTSQAQRDYKNQRIKLLLEEPIGNSNKWKEYKEFLYTINISISNDFDGF